MARRRPRGKPIELFPFLAILACVIGVLTLLIAGLSMGQLELDTSGSEFVVLQTAIQADRARIDTIGRADENLRIRGARVVHARAELERREEVGRETQKLEKQLAALERELEAARHKRDELRKGLEEVQDQLASLEGRLLGRRSELNPEKRVELAGPRARPGQEKLAPRFVECRETGIVIDPDRPKADQHVVPRDWMVRSKPFSELQSFVRERPERTVVLLVREGGVATHDLAAVILESRSVRFGSLPVPSALRIDFSMLRGGR